MLKRLLVVSSLCLGILLGTALVSETVEAKDCSHKGIRLWGKVQVVNTSPDIKVQLVESFADIHVEKVNSFPDKCGKWQIVTSNPDFKIQYVTSFPDIKVKFVNSFPGMQ